MAGRRVRPYPENFFLATNDGDLTNHEREVIPTGHLYGKCLISSSPSQQTYLWTPNQYQANNRQIEEPRIEEDPKQQALTQVSSSLYERKRSKFFPPADFPQPFRFRQFDASPVLARLPLADSTEGSRSVLEKGARTFEEIYEEEGRDAGETRAPTAHALREVPRSVPWTDFWPSPFRPPSWLPLEQRPQAQKPQEEPSQSKYPQEHHLHTEGGCAPRDELPILDTRILGKPSTDENDDPKPGEGPSSQRPKRPLQRSIERCEKCYCRFDYPYPHHSESKPPSSSESTLIFPSTIISKPDSSVSPDPTHHPLSQCSHCLDFYCTECRSPSGSGTGWNTGSEWVDHLRQLNAAERRPLRFNPSSYARGYSDREKDDVWVREVSDRAQDLKRRVAKGVQPSFEGLREIFKENVRRKTQSWARKQQLVGERIEDEVLGPFRRGRGLQELLGAGNDDEQELACHRLDRLAGTAQVVAAELQGDLVRAELEARWPREQIHGRAELGESNGRGWGNWEIPRKTIYQAFLLAGASHLDKNLERKRRQFERRQKNQDEDEALSRVINAWGTEAKAGGGEFEDDPDWDPIPEEYRVRDLGFGRRREMERSWRMRRDRTEWKGKGRADDKDDL